MLRYFNWPILLALFCFTGFIVLTLWRSDQLVAPNAFPSHDRVVIAAPILITLFGGDRFLAANLESIRLSATGIATGEADTFYVLRAHKVVADLNPCHENNYYLANALLTWGGAVDEGGDILHRATECRHWDELPPFFYGFNQYFFNRNIPEAQRLLKIAANRSVRNSVAFNTLAVMIEVEQFDDVAMALELLKRERDSAEDAKLHYKLDMRVSRLEGLALLREAQRQYEDKTGTPLSRPSELISAGVVDNFPRDPMNIGYEFADGRFRLKKARVAGMGER